MLPLKWNSSIARALNGLVEKNRSKIVETRRKLISLDEVLMHYPDKTLSTRSRYLRQNLLPILLKAGSPKFRTEYSRKDNESYYLGKHEARASIVEACGIWMQLEPALLDELPKTGGDTQSTLLHLICKGRELFVPGEVSANGGFVDYAEALFKKNVISPALASRITTICGLVLPKDQEEHLGLKTKLYSFVNFGTRGTQTTLKPESLEHLNTHCPELLGKLEGYEAPARAPKDLRAHWLFDAPIPSAKCAELNKLIDTKVLHPFRFLRLAAS